MFLVIAPNGRMSLPINGPVYCEYPMTREKTPQSAFCIDETDFLTPFGLEEDRWQ